MLSFAFLTAVRQTWPPREPSFSTQSNKIEARPGPLPARNMSSSSTSGREARNPYLREIAERKLFLSVR